MAGVRNQILIVEDDETLAQALVKAFTTEGYVVHSTPMAAEAKSLVNKHPIGTVFLDALLPEMSGFDLGKELRKSYPAQALEIVLMSGIFTDAKTIKDNTKATGAKAYLKKPFPIADALSQVEKVGEKTPPPIPVSSGVQAPLMHPRKALYQLFARDKVTVRAKRKAIDSLDEIYGFDLPFIYSLIVETATSGHLNVVVGGGTVFGISFSQGSIIGVDVPDKASYIGRLLVEQGFLQSRDLNTIIESQNPSQKRLGERLIGEGIISPHALDLALQQQMHIRLSQTILDQSVTCNFVESEVEPSPSAIDRETFTSFLHDWIASRVSPVWLKAHYTQWGTSHFRKTPWWTEEHPALKMPLVQSLPGVIPYILSDRSVAKILDCDGQFSEDALYKVVHFLMTKGLLAFSAPGAASDSATRRSELQRVLQQIDGKNPMELMELLTAMIGASRGTSAEQVNQEFGKILGPQPGPADAALLTIWKDVQSRVHAATEAIRKTGADQMRDQQAKADLEVHLQVEKKLEDIRSLLLKGQYPAASQLIATVSKLRGAGSRLKLVSAWASLAQITPPSDAGLLAKVELELLQVPIEEKHSAIFHFVQGLLAKHQQKWTEARSQLEKAVSLDPQFLLAKRELAAIATSQAKAGQSVLHADVRELVSHLFRKSS